MERGVGPGIGVWGPGSVQTWQRLGGEVSERRGGAPGSRIGDTGRGRKARPGSHDGKFRGRVGLGKGVPG